MLRSWKCAVPVKTVIFLPYSLNKIARRPRPILCVLILLTNIMCVCSLWTGCGKKVATFCRFLSNRLKFQSEILPKNWKKSYELLFLHRSDLLHSHSEKKLPYFILISNFFHYSYLKPPGFLHSSHKHMGQKRGQNLTFPWWFSAVTIKWILLLFAWISFAVYYRLTLSPCLQGSTSL